MFDELLTYYLREFYEKGSPALVTICNCVVPSKIILEQYKKFKPIEEIEESEKEKLKEITRELFPDKTPEEKMNAAKVIYTIGNLL